MSREQYDKGMKTRRKVLGDTHVDRAMSTMTPFNADFQDLITRYCWNDVWNRPGLSHKERRMLVLAMTSAQGRWEEFKLHTRAALQSGDLTSDDVKEILLQSAIYCGVPTANTAFKEAREVMNEMAAGPHAPVEKKPAKEKAKAK